MESSSGDHTVENRVWGVRSGDVYKIVAQVKTYLKAHAVNYQGHVDTL